MFNITSVEAGMYNGTKFVETVMTEEMDIVVEYLLVMCIIKYVVRDIFLVIRDVNFYF